MSIGCTAARSSPVTRHFRNWLLPRICSRIIIMRLFSVLPYLCALVLVLAMSSIESCSRSSLSSPIRSSPRQDNPSPESSPIPSSPPTPLSQHSTILYTSSEPQLSSASSDDERSPLPKRYKFSDVQVPNDPAFWPSVPQSSADALAADLNNPVYWHGSVAAPTAACEPEPSNSVAAQADSEQEAYNLVAAAAIEPELSNPVAPEEVGLVMRETSCSDTSETSTSSDEDTSSSCSNEDTLSCCSSAEVSSHDSSDLSVTTDEDSGDEQEPTVALDSLDKIYEGSEMTVDEGVLLLMDLFVKNSLEKSLLGSILCTVQRFLPRENLMPTSQHLLFQYVESLCPLSPAKIHYYCSSCHHYLGVSSKSCNLCRSTKNKKFFQLSSAEQIQNLFELHNLGDVIESYALSREPLSSTKIGDVCDGKEYKRASYGKKYDQVLLGHTDGISVSKSSSVSFWPLEFVIIEVPIHLRFRHMIIAGIWLDSMKPPVNTYLKPFTEELKNLSKNGVKWTHPVNKSEYTSYVCAPGFCADAPVRAQLQNILSHGGIYCCNSCEQKMVKLHAGDQQSKESGQVRNKRVFSFQNECARLRSAKRMKAQGEKTRKKVQQKPEGKVRPIKGVKGRSIVKKIPRCDRSTCVYPEYMHILLNVVKLFMYLWFETNANDQWSLKRFRDEIDAFLESIKVPDFVTRIPRPTITYKYWKANECRSFVLYFSLVVFVTYMKKEYFDHWILFVKSIYLLLQEKITQKDLDKAEIMLQMFLREFSKLYSSASFTYNLHNLLHLSLTVKRWGPLWSNSAFFFRKL